MNYYDLATRISRRNADYAFYHQALCFGAQGKANQKINIRSEEHTSELQSRENLVCRLLLEKKKNLIHCSP